VATVAAMPPAQAMLPEVATTRSAMPEAVRTHPYETGQLARTQGPEIDAAADRGGRVGGLIS